VRKRESHIRIGFASLGLCPKEIELLLFFLSPCVGTDGGRSVLQVIPRIVGGEGYFVIALEIDFSAFILRIEAAASVRRQITHIGVGFITACPADADFIVYLPALVVGTCARNMDGSTEMCHTLTSPHRQAFLTVAACQQDCHCRCCHHFGSHFFHLSFLLNLS
jgi:hypothetical protein